ncbi:MAG: universal stress protein [Kofleriaceae bacterium]
MEKSKPHVNIVVAFDFSPSADIALRRAIDVACRAPQHVLHVVTALDARHGLPIIETNHVDYAYAEKVQALIGDHVRGILAHRESAGPTEFFVHARIGRPAPEILGLANEVGADLIFIGCHGTTGLDRMLLGSVSERVVREAKCPVMVVREKTYDDVELLHVVECERAPNAYHPPLRFSYVDRSAITRPNNWPIG